MKFSFKHVFEFISDPDALQLPDGKKVTVNQSFLKIDLEKLSLSLQWKSSKITPRIALAVQGLYHFIFYFASVHSPSLNRYTQTEAFHTPLMRLAGLVLSVTGASASRSRHHRRI